ncbi:TIGR01777 family oxidoreductase [Actinomadura sp. ATCC 31491]|uniref:TIGR01777 family oxidoreductase n=1 Tax=Actinomadura luzonensis TaxID=2805427 RepID=A0ABT0G7Y5_9ACTN|nr:TIGR01777 family oxidoreductase [Actinomadura luzonensis]MCK2220619.1 TIGR01777 family oxidoreductase [Actinomadura luzonensis]
MGIIVTGASGLLGTALVEALRDEGREVVRLVRRPARGPGEVTWRPGDKLADPSALEGAEAAVHLAGAPIGDRRWSEAYKRELVASRVAGTRTLVDALRELSSPPEVLLSASGVDFYGDTGDREIDESQGKGDGFLADLCERWEGEAARAGEAGIRTVTLRTGLVLSGRGGMLGRVLPLFRMGLGAPLGSGRQYWSWITEADWVGAVLHLLREREVRGPVNLTSPGPVTNAAFTRTLARAVRRGAMPIPVPAFALSLGLGEFARAGLLPSHRVLPGKLAASGYRFAHTRLDEALRAVL